MKLLKVHGSGNLFYLVETQDEHSHDYVALAKWLCEKENNGGADGLLLVCPSSVALAKMRVINADGSEASMCGNGLRCVARYVCEKHGVTSADIETMKAVLHVEKQPPIFADLPTYAVEISPISFQLETLPMSYNNQQTIEHEVIEAFSPTILFTAISVPNPHLIGIVTEYYIKHQSHQYLLANYLNNDNQYCPDGVNVSYVYPIAEDEIYVRTYERGVGFTNACGTAMTASAYVAYKNGLVSSPNVTVLNPGGFVKCEIIEGEPDRLRLLGNATVEAEFTLKVENGYALTLISETGEAQQYEQCRTYVENKIQF